MMFLLKIPIQPYTKNWNGYDEILLRAGVFYANAHKKKTYHFA